MKILVTGGTGYIGSFTVRALCQRGDEVVVFDNLVCGHRQAVPAGVPLVVGDLLEREKLEEVFAANRFGGVVHFAAYALAGESMADPYKYLHGNIQGSLNLAQTMKTFSVRNLVFSSSCTVYGEPGKNPVTEESPLQIANVYGESKLASERIFSWYDKLFGLKSVFLRYFNAAGAALDGSGGEDHRPETHLIPLVVMASLRNQLFTVFGRDYPTPDGTNVRDYIHVLDLAQAHLLALDFLEKGERSDFFNLGIGRGYSNLEVVKVVEEVGGKKINLNFGSRRLGDAAAIYADNTKACRVLGWTPHYGLKEIVESAYLWRQSHPRGYG